MRFWVFAARDVAWHDALLSDKRDGRGGRQGLLAGYT